MVQSGTIAATGTVGSGRLPLPVSVRGLTKHWPGASRPVFAQLDVNCPAGGITIIVGPSGCGKTTLLRCLCGLDKPTSGSILFGDVDVTAIDAQRRGVAMVFQNYALYPTKTVFENIGFPLRMARLDNNLVRKRVEAAAELTRIGELLHRLPSQLSGGQRQRVGIARAIVRGPSVLLMDEPLSNLDTKLRIEMRAELGALQRELGSTTVYVTHDQTEALALADHLIVMRDGRVEQQGTPEETFMRPANTFVADFLGSMNLLDIERTGAGPSTAGVPVTVPNGAPGMTSFRLGFRAEDACLRQVRADDALIAATVRRSELMGTERLVHLDCGGTMLRARLKTPVTPGEMVRIFVPADALHFFDARGNRMERRA